MTQTRRTLTTTQLHILQTLHQLPLSSPDQLCRAVGLSRESRHIYRHLGVLRAGRYVAYRPSRAKPGGGADPGVYYLQARGSHALLTAGLIVTAGSGRRLPPEAEVSHCLLENDVLLVTRELATICPHVQLVRCIHELDPTGPQPLVRLPTGRSVPLMHDGFVELSLSGAPLCIWWELDRSSEYQVKFRKKIRALSHYAARTGSYWTDFHPTSLLIAVLTTGPKARASTLYDWTLAELERQGLAEELAGRFFITSSSEDSSRISAKQLYLDAIWRNPSTEEPLPLIPRPG